MANSTKAAHKANKKDDKAIKLTKRHDNSYDIHITKNPLKTTPGKIVIWIILAGFIILPFIAVIVAIVNWIGSY